MTFLASVASEIGRIHDDGGTVPPRSRRLGADRDDGLTRGTAATRRRGLGLAVGLGRGTGTGEGATARGRGGDGADIERRAGGGPASTASKSAFGIQGEPLVVRDDDDVVASSVGTRVVVRLLGVVVVVVVSFPAPSDETVVNPPQVAFAAAATGRPTRRRTTPSRRRSSFRIEIPHAAAPPPPTRASTSSASTSSTSISFSSIISAFSRLLDPSPLARRHLDAHARPVKFPHLSVLPPRPRPALVADLAADHPAGAVLDQFAQFHGRVHFAAPRLRVDGALEAGGEGGWQGRRGRHFRCCSRFYKLYYMGIWLCILEDQIADCVSSFSTTQSGIVFFPFARQQHRIILRYHKTTYFRSNLPPVEWNGPQLTNLPKCLVEGISQMQ
mmetsp:Transcript_3353/g.7399  ORF Transcript_3353/g.7399 Transcript_3353/m.7399 type:complete len:386 (+) Transcript_3353:1008-2165(+)